MGHCHSVMHEFAAHAHTETIQIFKFSGGGGIEAGGRDFQGPPLYETLANIPPCNSRRTTKYDLSSFTATFTKQFSILIMNTMLKKKCY